MLSWVSCSCSCGSALARAEFESSLGFFTVKGWSWSTLISLSARLIPSCTSGHSSFSSLRTSLVSSGVGGTALYCETHLFWITWSIVRRSSGLVFRHPLMRSLASEETFVHSGLGNSYWPERILFFMPGEMGRPWLE